MTSKKFPPIPPYYPAPSEGWNYPQPGPGFPDFQAAEPASGGLHKGQFPGVPAPVFHVDLETNADGVPVADSVGISVRFGKDHKNVLRAIDDVFARGEKGRLNFAPSSYRANNGKDERCYLLNRDGFAFIVMGFTGKNADDWKWAYIEAFNRMEAALRNREPEKPKSTLELLESAVAEIKARDLALAASERDNRRLEQISGYQGVIIQKYEDELVGFSRISDTSASWSVTTVAALLGQPRNKFCEWLRTERFTYPFETGHKNPGWQPYADIRANGLMVLRFHNGRPGYDDFDAGYGHPSSRFTMKGILHLAARQDLPFPRKEELRRVRENIRLRGNPFDDGSE